MELNFGMAKITTSLTRNASDWEHLKNSNFVLEKDSEQPYDIIGHEHCTRTIYKMNGCVSINWKNKKNKPVTRIAECIGRSIRCLKISNTIGVAHAHTEVYLLTIILHR